jgi:hypothetical protein
MNILNQLCKAVLNIQAIVIISYKNIFNSNKSGVNGIVFSMDRPIQLHALLSSYYIYCDDASSLYVLYKASNYDYSISYDELIETYKNKNIKFIKETNFRKDLINILENISTDFIFFLVDDNIFKRKFSFSNIFSIRNFNNYIFSLRLGKNLNYCYTLGFEQELPTFKKVDNFISWKFTKSVYDWNYVFSVDGHIYQTSYIQTMSKLINFKAPNSYESNMNIFKYIFYTKLGICFENSVLINLCLNRVQEEINNVSGDISPLELLKYWNDKKEIDFSIFKNIENRSAHIEIVDLHLISRI